MLFFIFAVAAVAMSIRMVEATSRIDLNPQGDPTILLTPNPANPGAFVEVSGTGFAYGPSECSISSSPPTLFQGSVGCFAGNQGNITGIFQVNTLAPQGAYVVLVTDQTSGYNTTYLGQYKVPFNVVPPLPAAVVLKTTTVSATVATTRLATTTQTSTYTTTREISSGITLPQTIIFASSTAAVTAVAARIYVRHTGATIRMGQRGGIKRRPGFAFDVDVRSGIDREESSG